MFNLSPKWNFPSNNHSQIIGIADSGVEMFKGTPIKSLAREICQNSLDARLDDSQPARIEFETFEIDPKNIPGAKTLEDVFKRCLDFWQIQDSDQARKFFKQAIKDMNRSSIKCLRISDFNTSGLTGSRAEYNWIAIPDRIFLLMTISFIYTNRVKSRFAEHFTGRVDKPAVFAYYNRNKGVVCPFGKKRTALTRRVRPACA